MRTKLTINVPCKAKRTTLTLEACLDEFVDVNGKAELRRTAPQNRKACYRCPEGARRREQYANS